MLRGAVICVLSHKQSEILTGQGSYAIVLLVSPLGSLTIAKCNGVSVYCSVVAHFSALYVYYYRKSCPYIIARDSLHKRYNFCHFHQNHATKEVSRGRCVRSWKQQILRKYSGNVCACASSRYQAVSLLLCSLGTRLPKGSHSFCNPL